MRARSLQRPNWAEEPCVLAQVNKVSHGYSPVDSAAFLHRPLQFDYDNLLVKRPSFRGGRVDFLAESLDVSVKARFICSQRSLDLALRSAERSSNWWVWVRSKWV